MSSFHFDHLDRYDVEPLTMKAKYRKLDIGHNTVHNLYHYGTQFDMCQL